jgi:glycosyltransferase involved in cell wall biosynthesis
MDNMNISVIIPTYNRGKKILGSLEALCRQTIAVDEFEVLVVDDGSTDDTQSCVQGFFDAKNLQTWKLLPLYQNAGKPAALNAGIKEAKGIFILFTDDDIIPERPWVEAHLNRHIKESRNVAVVGSVRYPDEWVRTSNLVKYHNSRYIGQNGNRITRLISSGGSLPPSHYAGGNSSVPKEILLSVGMFNEKMRRGEDGELAIRLIRRGVELIFEPKAEVVHYDDNVFYYEKWLKKFRNYYGKSAKEVIERYHDEYNRWGHWFVEKPKWGKENVKRCCVKSACRLIARPRIGGILTRFLEIVDSASFFYHPLFYQYVLACEAINEIDHRS